MMAKPLQLTPSDEDEQQLFSELLPDDRPFHHISKGEPTEGAHYVCLNSLGLDPYLVTIGEDWILDGPLN